MPAEHSNEPAAAPPDDGHLGTFTRPEDTMQREEVRQNEPQLHRDPNPNRQSSGLLPAIVLTLIGIGVIALVLYLIA